MAKTLKHRRERCGGAMIEVAVTLPLLVGLTMSTIETCRFLYIKQSVKIAAHEAARLGIVPGATLENVSDLCTLILANRNLRNFEVICDPSDLGSLNYGDHLHVTIDLPLSENMLVGSWLFSNQRLAQTVTIMAEY